MKIRIHFPASPTDPVREVDVDSPGLSVMELLELIAETSWGEELVENKRVKSPYALIIDEKLILMKDTPDLVVTENSDVKFVPMFTGG